MYTKRIAYFSMGSGIYNDLLTYSGGLEILAGDMIKEVIDHKDLYPMTFFHILWKKGYSLQRVLDNGNVVDEEPENNNWKNYLVDTKKQVTVKIFNRDVIVKIWKLKAGPVYYLDTDLPENGDLCNITYNLYGGAWDNSEKERIAQEIVLGIGGVRAINALGLSIDGYHYNDGHPAFAGIELISEQMKIYYDMDPDQTTEQIFEHALRHVKSRTAFTTHTNVPAGNESHSIELLMEVGANVDLTYQMMERIGGNPFGMTVASLRLASMANGVSRLQVLAAKDMWHWVKDAPNIIAITNGVHKGTWQDKSIAKAFENNDIDELFNAHQICKIKLIDFIHNKTGVKFKEDKLLIAFARRATEYKRWDLIFRDREKFESLIKKYGIQIVFAGKSHPHDGSGKNFISEIYHLSKKYPENVVFLEGYNIEMAQKLVAGADVWLNNPRVPLEACGTSGMKAAMNGTLNLSTLDGWWREASMHDINGWNIGNGEFSSTSFQDENDARALRHILIQKVIPTYYNNKEKWKAMMYASIVTANQYTTTRMVEEYYVNLYNYLKA